MNETLVKYLAGLFDADGTIQFIYRPLKDGYRLQVHMSVDGAESIDKKGFIPSLPGLTELGTTTSRVRENWSPVHTWHVCKRSDLEKIIPRITKHMVLKGTHFMWCLEMLRATQGKVLSSEEVDLLKESIKQSRINTKWRTAKKHPSWYWTAGFLDGDGYYSLRHNKKTGRTTIRMGAVAHERDRATLDLLHKAFGGSLYKDGNVIRWHRNLGPKDANFSLPFLAKMSTRSRLKQHKIETIIHHIRQRLSEKKPKG